MLKEDGYSVSETQDLTDEEDMISLQNPKKYSLSGIGRLASDAINGVTNIVESVHKNAFSPIGKTTSSGLNSISGMTEQVYRNIRTISNFIGGGVDALIDQFNTQSGNIPAPLKHSVTLAALNGVIGDHLVKRSNPLAIKMCFRRDGLPLDVEALAKVIEEADGKIVIMVHGSCRNDLQWERNGHDHGAAIRKDLGLEPIYLYYNSGCHISENGREFSELLDQLSKVSAYPLELVIVAHSMGGLVTRSACHYSSVLGHNWLNLVRKIVFLGTPHHGANLEKVGNLVDAILDTNRYSAPFSQLGKIRSSGVTDLRFGYTVDDDWKGKDRFRLSRDHRTPVPLPESVPCYAIAATAGKSSNLLNDGLVGDGLVTVNSALGCHKKSEFHLAFPEENKWIGRNMSHLSLLDNPKVYATLKNWLSA